MDTTRQICPPPAEVRLAAIAPAKSARLSAALGQVRPCARKRIDASISAALDATAAHRHGATQLIVDEAALVAADPETLAALGAARARLATVAMLPDRHEIDSDLLRQVAVEALPWRELETVAFRRVLLHARTVAALEARINDQRAEIERFSRLLAHDLGAPVSSLQRLLDITANTLERPMPGPDAKDAVERARGAARRVGALLETLKRRVAVEHVTLVRAAPLDAAARAAAEALRSETADTSARAAIACADLEILSLPATAHCSDQMAEVFRQLIKNAVTYTHASRPQVRVHGEEFAGRLEIFVDDDGFGVPEDQLDEIFEPLARLHGPQQFPGAGLGLTLCRSVISAMRGRIWAENREDGGLRVRLSLPKQAGGSPGALGANEPDAWDAIG